MDGRLRNPDDGGELADGEVGAEGAACHEQAAQRRAGARTSTAPGHGEHRPEASQFVRGEAPRMNSRRVGMRGVASERVRRRTGLAHDSPLGGLRDSS
jgi:hypothetical protein